MLFARCFKIENKLRFSHVKVMLIIVNVTGSFYSHYYRPNCSVFVSMKQRSDKSYYSLISSTSTLLDT